MVPAIFNINEPVLFGLPIVMNPVLAIPFILTPILSCIIQYSAIYFGLTPMYGAVQVPWTCPPIISGFIIGGWKTALLQTLILVMSFLFIIRLLNRWINKIYKLKYKKQAI